MSDIIRLIGEWQASAKKHALAALEGDCDIGDEEWCLHRESARIYRACADQLEAITPATLAIAQARPEPAAMTERLIQAAVDYEQAGDQHAAAARRELSEARAAIEAALSTVPSTTLGGEAREKEITRLATIEECARLAENTGLRNPENIARDIRALAVTSTDRGTQ